MQTKSKLSDAGDFIALILGPDEIRQLDEFASALSRFSAQSRFVVIPHAVADSENARSAYVTSPTAENFEVYLRAATHEAILEKLLPGSVSLTIDDAWQAFVKARIQPALESILRRALTAARTQLQTIATEEIRHHEEITGQSISFYSVEDEGKLASEFDEKISEAEQAELEARNAGIAANIPILTQAVHRLRADKSNSIEAMRRTLPRSPIVELARQPVARLEELLAESAKPYSIRGSVLPFLRSLSESN